jgi:hypothetical protein
VTPPAGGAAAGPPEDVVVLELPPPPPQPAKTADTRARPEIDFALESDMPIAFPCIRLSPRKFVGISLLYLNTTILHKDMKNIAVRAYARIISGLALYTMRTFRTKPYNFQCLNILLLGSKIKTA